VSWSCPDLVSSNRTCSLQEPFRPSFHPLLPPHRANIERGPSLDRSCRVYRSSVPATANGCDRLSPGGSHDHAHAHDYETESATVTPWSCSQSARVGRAIRRTSPIKRLSVSDIVADAVLQRASPPLQGQLPDQPFGRLAVQRRYDLWPVLFDPRYLLQFQHTAVLHQADLVGLPSPNPKYILYEWREHADAVPATTTDPDHLAIQAKQLSGRQSRRGRGAGQTMLTVRPQAGNSIRPSVATSPYAPRILSVSENSWVRTPPSIEPCFRG
jgi:hypothetical protein